MRRGLSSVRGLVVVVVVLGVLGLVVLVLGYAMAAGDRELPSMLVRYVLAPLVSLSLGGSAFAHWLRARRASGRVPELGAARAGPAPSGDVPMPCRSRAKADPPRRVRGSQDLRLLPTSPSRPRKSGKSPAPVSR